MKIHGVTLRPITVAERQMSHPSWPSSTPEPGGVWAEVWSARHSRHVRTYWVPTYEDEAMTVFAGWECLNPCLDA